MRVKIKGTGKIRHLEYVDPDSGVSVEEDLMDIGTNDAFEWDGDEGVYHASQEEYDWWHALFEDMDDADAHIAEAKEEYGSGVITAYLAETCGGAWDDLDCVPNNIREALADTESLEKFAKQYWEKYDAA